MKTQAAVARIVETNKNHTFDDLELIPALLSAIDSAGYSQPTAIQQQAIPPALAGRDVLGCAQTGTGKTAAFALPVLQHLDARATNKPKPRALVLTPTRELAAQISASFETYGSDLDLWHTVVYGGVSDKPQIAELRRGVDALVATPGRLLDLMGQGVVRLDDVELFVLDEADRMLDMGFLPDVRRITKELPEDRQTLFFSATMPPEIRKLAEGLLDRPVSVAVAPISSTVEVVDQRVFFTDKADKRKLLAELLREPEVEHTLVFSRTKHGANRIVQMLAKADIRAEAIHGNKSQGARTRALDAFRSGSLSVLVATDIAARGIDVDGVTHVINFDLPNVPETYVHRIGRTARAGASGVALSFCDREEQPLLAEIEKLIGKRLTRGKDYPFAASWAPTEFRVQLVESKKQTKKRSKTISNKIFAGNLDFGVTDQQLRELFSEVGEVVEVHIPTDRDSGRPRGFAFVRFANDEQAARAVEEMNGRDVSGRALRLDIAEDRPRQSRPRRDYGGPPPRSFDKPSRPKGSRRGLRAKKRS